MSRAPRGSRIHRGLVGERALVGTPYLADAGLRREYADEIAPRTTAALGKILDEVYAEAPAPTRALDLGAGTGAAGATLRARFGAALEVVAVDRVRAPGIVVIDLELERELPRDLGRFDLVVAAHVLNELFGRRDEATRVAERAARVLAWARALAPGGTLILVEPALRETSRALLAVRDRVLAAGLHVVAPCFFTGPCPALARERDWCHDAAKVPSSPRVDFSWLALRPSPPPARLGEPLRVVSDALVEKGRLKIFACGAGGRGAYVRLDRAASEANADFARLERGDVFAFEGEPPAATADGARVAADAVVTRRAGASPRG
ncbi:MAG TPA: small ribosomal subunit Rsm22 family protein [Polyangia bacterium]|nr:small ribosomal subunit Rsm22 family protein [Polyangia bacterium]